MKTKLIFLLSCFIIGALNAQNSKFFSIDSTYSTRIFLDPKGVQIDKSVPLLGHYYFDANEKFIQELLKIYKETFGDIDEEIKTALFRGGQVTFFFDKNLHIYYFQFGFSKQYSPIILGIEDKLFEFAERFKKIDLSIFIEIQNKETFQNAPLMVLFGCIINYDKHPEKFHAEKIFY
ncbi:MAG: hypothetical protein PHX50_00150 [Massilibacteroides sp.]|nr:hypothetical protein [Massilibacteroides sp.]MDD3061231.1 hypothetical protein [Massilibacteroides sp.]